MENTNDGLLFLKCITITQFGRTFFARPFLFTPVEVAAAYPQPPSHGPGYGVTLRLPSLSLYTTTVHDSTISVQHLLQEDVFPWSDLSRNIKMRSSCRRADSVMDLHTTRPGWYGTFYRASD